MTSNKKFGTIILFVVSLAFSVMALMVGLLLMPGATDLEQIEYIIQMTTNLNFLSSMLSFGVIIALISDMD